jgi:flavin reductase (DIM6/NTAB) family NADH-FMN oxidoreductase RutF
MDQSLSPHKNEPWIELTEKKQFSRLLYTNPVCFLSTLRGGESLYQWPDRNVMVLSWLTATSNEGTFTCSINRRRHTASVLLSGVSEFVLSVPVMGMETLVRDVGQASGKRGSKFPQDHDSGQVQKQAEVSEEHMSKRQAKKRSRMSLNTLGVPGLEAVPFGNESRTQDAQPFAIRGTVAHLNCSIYKRLDDVIDDNHFLILARVTAAYVKPAYWDSTKSVFRADSQNPPHLTFLGSQEFGHVVARNSDA